MCVIAIAEDYPKTREIFLSLIQQISGCVVSIEVCDGHKLVKAILSSKKPPDIVILDIKMPLMDGLYTTHFLCSRYPEIKVLGTSVNANPLLISEMFRSGAKGYILKENLILSLLSEVFTAFGNGEIFLDAKLENKNLYKAFATEFSNNPGKSSRMFSEKENTFLQLTATAISYEQIGELMNVSKDSVYNYQKTLKEKLGISTRQELMLYAIQHGIAKVARFDKVISH